MTQPVGGAATEDSGPSVMVDAAVRVYPDTPNEIVGYVVEDFGDISGQAVDIGEHHIVDAARRWAVRLADGSLVFVDDGDLAAIE